MADQYPPMTQLEFLTELKARFGDDPMDWAFICPSCGDIATGRDFRQALAEHAQYGPPVTASDLLGQECIGRTLGALEHALGEHYIGRGCNWTAYGLFKGPQKVIMPGRPEDRPSWSFPIAPVPVKAERAASGA